MPFFIFLKSVFEIGENEPKLGPMPFLQLAPQLGDDPIAHLKPPSITPAATLWCDLNQDLSKFWRSRQRREVKMGIKFA